MAERKASQGAFNINRNRRTISYMSSKSHSLSLGSNRVRSFMQIGKTKKSTLVFEVDLASLVQRERLASVDGNEHLVPQIVDTIVKYLEEEAINEPGLFRISGKHSILMSASTAIDEGQAVTKEYLKDLDIYTIADLLKLYLRKLPEAIVPVKHFFPAFLTTTNIKDDNMLMEYTGALLRMLPSENFYLLNFLCKFFNSLTEQADTTKMGAQNIAIIFSPVFFGQSEYADGTQALLEVKATTAITKMLVESYEELFIPKCRASVIMFVSDNIMKVEKISLIKGEEIVVFYISENEDLCYVQKGALFAEVSREILESKCKPLPSSEQGKQVDKEEIENIRRSSISSILSLSALPKVATGNTISVGKVSAKNRSPAGIKPKKRYSHILRKTSSKSDDIDSPSLDLSPSAKGDGKSKKKKEKKKEKKINSTISAWYGHNANKSSASFFEQITARKKA